LQRPLCVMFQAAHLCTSPAFWHCLWQRINVEARPDEGGAGADQALFHERQVELASG
jgi:hypothetical protein